MESLLFNPRITQVLRLSRAHSEVLERYGRVGARRIAGLIELARYQLVDPEDPPVIAPGRVIADAGISVAMNHDRMVLPWLTVEINESTESGPARLEANGQRPGLIAADLGVKAEFPG